MLAQSHFQLANPRNGKGQRTKKKLKHMHTFASEVVLYIAPDTAGHSKKKELPKPPAATLVPKQSEKSVAYT